MPNNECLVSILCTAYNHEPYIRQTLEGFVNQQTDFRFEVLINDDASTDGTAAVIREFEEKYPDIIRPFYQEKNLYSQDIDIYQAVFFPNARGKYVAYCEGDDYWTDMTKLQRQADFLESHPEYSACVHNTMLHYCDGSKPDELLINGRGEHDVEFQDIIPGMSLAYHTSSLMAKREILASPPDFYFTACKYGFGDHPDALWLRLNGKIHFIDRAMSVYRLNSTASSWTTGVDGQYGKLRSFITGQVELLRAFRKHAPDDCLEFLDRYILTREFDLLYTEGRDREMLKPPYNAILREKPLAFRVNTALKCFFPRLHRLYRRLSGYRE